MSRIRTLATALTLAAVTALTLAPVAGADTAVKPPVSAREGSWCC
jgi:hypothetical protein